MTTKQNSTKKKSTLSFKADLSFVQMIDLKAKESNMTRTEFLKEMVNSGIDKEEKVNEVVRKLAIYECDFITALFENNRGKTAHFYDAAESIHYVQVDRIEDIHKLLIVTYGIYCNSLAKIKLPLSKIYTNFCVPQVDSLVSDDSGQIAKKL